MPGKKAEEESGRVKWTIRIRNDLRRAVRVLAAQTDRDAADVVEEALQEYLKRARRGGEG